MTKTTAYNTALGLPMLPPLAATSLGKSADHMMQLIGFHSLYNVPMQPLGCDDSEFLHMDDDRVALRLGLIVEEFKELFEDGFGITPKIGFIIQNTDVPEDGVPLGVENLARRLSDARDRDRPRDGAAVADALGDLVYVIYGLALEMGYDLRDVIQEIHGSNMTKLGEDGKPIYREDGKVLKGKSYMPPNIPAALGWE